MNSVCQAAAENCNATSQTTWFRSVHASVQYSTMHYEQEQVRITSKTGKITPTVIRFPTFVSGEVGVLGW